MSRLERHAGILICYSWVPLSVACASCSPVQLAGTSCHWAGASAKTMAKPPAIRQLRRRLAGSRGGVGEHPREAEQLPHGFLAVGVLADAQREVIGRDRAEITMVGFAVLVAAVSGLELQVRQDVPADGQHHLRREGDA